MRLLAFLFCFCACDRGISERMGDAQIDLSLKRKIYRIDPNLDFSINRTVYRGDVLLTGYAPSETYKQQVEMAARSIPGIQNVYNHIALKENLRFFDYTRDTGINQEIKTHLMFDSEVSSSHIHVQTFDGVIYLMGTARSKYELDKVVHYARHINGVKKVVCYIKSPKDEGQGEEKNDIS